MSEPVGAGSDPKPPGVRLISANRCCGSLSTVCAVVIKDALRFLYANGGHKQDVCSW